MSEVAAESDSTESDQIATEESSVVLFPYCEQIAADVAGLEEFKSVRDEIIRLRVELNMRAEDVVTHVNGNLPLREGMSEATAVGIIRRICAIVIPEETRRKISETLHRNVITKHMDSVQEGRARWMRENNLLVWDEEQTEYFEALLASSDYQRKQRRTTTRRLQKTNSERQRATHYNHGALSEAMRIRFNRKEFTVDATSRKLERIRLDEKNLKVSQSIQSKDAVVEDRAIPTLRSKHLELLKDFSLEKFIRWLYLETEIKAVELNIHEMNRALALFAPFIKEEQWQEFLDEVVQQFNTFTPSMQQFLIYIASECHIRLDELQHATKALEFGIRNGGVLTERLNTRLVEVSKLEPRIIGRDARSRRHVPSTKKSKRA